MMVIKPKYCEEMSEHVENLESHFTNSMIQCLDKKLEIMELPT